MISIKQYNECLFKSFVFLFLLLTADTAFAAGNDQGWRATYDEVMIWVNFGILVFLFFKYAKTPLMSFLRTQSDALTRDIEGLEESKNKSDQRNKELLEELEKRDAHIDEIKKRIILEGEKEREKIISDAKFQSEAMLKDARQRMANQIRQAKTKLQHEILDEVISVAMERLPREITEEDNNALLDNYFAALEEK